MAEIKVIRSSLKSRYKDSDEIVIAWWDRDWFEELLDRKLDDEDWQIVLASSEKVLEFMDLGDQLMWSAERELDEAKRPRKPRVESKPKKKPKKKKKGR
ncbi:MAG: hypothetical protein ACKOQ6_12575 [Bacteroidota bacterium]